MATVQILLDVLLMVHGLMSVAYGGVALTSPGLLEMSHPAWGEGLHPPVPVAHHAPGLLHEALLLFLEAGEVVPGPVGALATRSAKHWRSTMEQGFHHTMGGQSTSPATSEHALWFRLFGLHLLTTGVVATCIALGVNDRRAKLWTARGLAAYLTLAWLLVKLDAKAGGVASKARGATLILGSLAAVYTLVLLAIDLTWPRAQGQHGAFGQTSHVHHKERAAVHETRHHSE